MKSKVVHNKLRVEFEDCDAMGVVYHPNYLRFVERSRVDFLRAHGVPYSSFMNSGAGLVIAEIHSHYWRPAKFEEELHVYTRQVSYDPKRLVLEQYIARDAVPAEDHHRPMDKIHGKVFGAKLTLVPVNLKTMRSEPLPESIAQVLRELTIEIR